MNYKHSFRGALAGVALLSFAAGAAGANKVPLDHFFTHNIYLQPTLSPSGRYLSVITWDPKVPDRNILAIYDLQKKAIYREFSLRHTDTFTQELFWHVRWITDNRIVFGSAEHYGALDSRPYYTGKIYSVDVAGKDIRLLQGPWAGNPHGFSILRTLPNDSDHFLTESYFIPWGGWNASRNSDASPSVFLINTIGNASHDAAIKWGKGTTANGHRIMTSPLGDGRLIADRDGHVRVAIGSDSDEMEWSYRPDVSSKWKTMPGDLIQRIDTWLVGFTPDEKSLYLVDYTPKGGTLGLYRFNPETGKKDLLFADPKVDVDNSVFYGDGLIFGPKGEKVEAVETMYGRPKISLLDGKGPVEKVLSAFSAAFPGQYPEILSWSRDGSKAVVVVYSDRNPGKYYLVDTRTMHAAPLPFNFRPDIKPANMAPMQPIEFKARDGMTIHGYLTLPIGKLHKNLPMIVFVHGGPFGIRDRWGYQTWVQLLANRGYAVLQVNYRGSAGYGVKYLQAGFSHWGTTMQYDVIDGTKWVVKQGYVNPKRICIFGISYGGYAAIRSAEIAPDLYQCTVGDAGVYDLPMMVDDSGDSRSYFDKVFRGLTQADLAQQSPVNHVKRLTGGIYLVQGGADYTVSPKQFDELKKRLDAAGKHYLSLYKQYEGHGFGKVSDRRELAKKLLTFFNHWIGPQSGQQVAAASR